MDQAQITSLEQAYQAIQDAMKEEKWAQAYQICLDVLRIDPENLKVIHWKNKIEKSVKKANQNAIKEDIQKLEPLWKEHKYKELLENFKQLEPYIKDYPSLSLLILKAKKKYEQQLSGELEQNFQDDVKKIEELLKAHKYQEAIIITEKMVLMGIHYQDVKKIAAKIRREWIDNECELNKGLLSGEKYENILLFYQKLLKIDPESVKLKNAIDQTKKVYQAFKIDEKKEFLYKSLEQMKTLYQLGKYEKSLQVCNEILAIDPENKTVRAFQKNSDSRAQKIINTELLTQMITNRKSLQDEYKTNPKAFTRI